METEGNSPARRCAEFRVRHSSPEEPTNGGGAADGHPLRETGTSCCVTLGAKGVFAGVAELRLLQRGDELGYLGGPSVITRVLIREAGGSESEETRRDHRSRSPSQREDPKVEEGAASQGVRMGPDAAQGRGTEPPVEPPEGTQPCPPRVSAPGN